MNGILFKEVKTTMPFWQGEKKRKFEIMKTIQQLNESKVPVVIIDPKLNALDEQVLFPDKVKKARVILDKIGLPETNRKSTRHRVHLDDSKS